MKKYIYLPKDLWLLIFFNSLPIFIIFFVTLAVLVLCGVEGLLFSDTSKFQSFLMWLALAPLTAGYMSSIGWGTLKLGNIVLRLIAIAKGDL